MGRVYRARDTRLGRFVAIKLLPAGETSRDAIARMRREAEAASSLNDSAIVTIYDIGESESAGLFIAMELIEGSNLREWLRSKPSRENKLEIMRQVAKGLSVAHSHGIIHRDIKPENIMITAAGAAKIVDFGLAKPVEVTSGSTDVKITAHGHVAGTLAYMSPEQLAGEPVDARSDIYSFGLVLRDVFGADDPALRRVIERCVQRDRLLRYQSMDAVLLEKGKPVRRVWAVVAVAAIVAIATAAVIGYRPAERGLPDGSIAVLPFRALGAQAYLADGITDAVTTDLARQPGLAVIARNSSKRFAPDGDLRAAASDLNARYVLVGSVQPVGSGVRVDARLVDATSGSHVWADHFDRPLSEVLAAESEIVRAVAAKLHPAAAARGISKPSDSRVADLYLRARFFSDDREWSVQDRSIPLLEQVVQLDAGFLPAHIVLAQQYQRKAFESDPERLWNQKAYVEIEKILAQDPNSSDAFAIRASLHYNVAHGFDVDPAIADYNHAVRLDSNNVTALQGRGAMMMHFGLLDEALSDFNRVLRLDPFNDFAGYRVARIHLFQQQCSLAATEFGRRWPND